MIFALAYAVEHLFKSVEFKLHSSSPQLHKYIPIHQNTLTRKQRSLSQAVRCQPYLLLHTVDAFIKKTVKINKIDHLQTIKYQKSHTTNLNPLEPVPSVDSSEEHLFK